jgi:Tol biopolymer transport system component
VIAELVGHYRVVSNLGSGGMGVVWKAIDTRLNRPVALKAIRDTGPGNTDAVLRLRAEALAAASLDHPYICKIYELLETGDATMVVMEFVEGETLGDILMRRTPALVDTLRYGAEIAEGLANAHARGIVHRDVKPNNVMVTPHGHIKLLDFGIARVTVLDNAVTQSGLTLPGDVPGTPQYMAPEQALGRPLDGRTDLFSLGVVLFRCLTGQLPFEGNTRDEYVQEMLSSRMRPIDELAPSAPYAVREIVKACLQRDPDKRPESAAVVSETLKRAADALSTGSLPIAAATPRGLQRWAVQVALLAFAITAGVFALLQWAIRTPDEAPRELRPAVTWPSAEYGARISPDGQWLSFISDKQGQPRVFVQKIESGSAVPVDVQGTVVSHAWSPNGQELACVVRQGDSQFLVVVPAFFGGSPRVSVALEKGIENVTVSRWVGDQAYVYFDRGAFTIGFSRIDLKTGATENLGASWPTTPRLRSVDVSPAGDRIVLEGASDGRFDLWTANPDGSGLKRLTDDAYVDRYPVWTGSDTIAFQSNRAGQLDLWQMSVTTGRVSQLTSSQGAERASDSSVSGALVAFEQLSNANNLWRMDAAGALRQLTGDALPDFWPSVSEVGRRIAFQRTKPTPTEGFEFMDARVLFAPMTGNSLEPQQIADGFWPRLSPDGTWLAHYQRIPGRDQLRILVKNLVTGEGRMLTERATLPGLSVTSLPIDWIEQNMLWGQDGALYFCVNTDAGGAIQRADLSTRSEPQTIATGAGRLRDLRLSTDGQTLAWIAGPREQRQLRLFGLQERRELPPVQLTSKGFYFFPGWSGPTTLILAHQQPVSSGTNELVVSELSVAGPSRVIATISDAAGPAARLDPPRMRLFVTRVVDGVHNLFTLSLADGTWKRLTANEAPGVSYSGVHVLADGGLVFGREERKRDIWLVERKSR